jgi:hypothetical protein
VIHLVYVPEHGDPADGDQLASGTGWLGWCEWVDGLADGHPEAAHLAEEGWADAGELEGDLEALLDEDGPADALSVTRRLLSAVRARPGGTAHVLVTDGTGGDQDDEGSDGHR